MARNLEKLTRDLEMCEERIALHRADIVRLATDINLDEAEIDYTAMRLAWWIDQRRDILKDIRAAHAEIDAAAHAAFRAVLKANAIAKA